MVDSNSCALDAARMDPVGPNVDRSEWKCLDGGQIPNLKRMSCKQQRRTAKTILTASGYRPDHRGKDGRCLDDYVIYCLYAENYSSCRCGRRGFGHAGGAVDSWRPLRQRQHRSAHELQKRATWHVYGRAARATQRCVQPRSQNVAFACASDCGIAPEHSPAAVAIKATGPERVLPRCGPERSWGSSPSGRRP